MLRTASITFSYMLNYLKSLSLGKEDTLENKNKNLMCLNTTLRKYGGLLSKVSQMLCYEKYNDDVFSDCKPVYRKKTLENTIKKYKNNEFHSGLTHLEPTVFKSGSVGQIHRGTFNGKDVILKVLYEGLYKQTVEDFKILEVIARYMYSTTDLTFAMEDIKNSIYIEYDFENERKQQVNMKKIWKHDENIVIPTIIPELCSKNEVCMEFLKGEVLNRMIDNLNTDEKKSLCITITKFLFKNILEHQLLYSDVHAGNFIVLKDDDVMKLGVLDFGCIQFISENILDFIKNTLIILSSKNPSKTEFLNEIVKIGILDSETIKNDEITEYMFEYFKTQYEPFTSDYIECTKEWLDKVSHKNIEKMKVWKLPKGMVYFNRFIHGLFCLYSIMGFNGCLKKNIIEYIYI